MKNFAHNSGQYLQVDGAKIYYETSGKEDSPALLFLHGGFGNIEDFNAILPDLDKEFLNIRIWDMEIVIKRFLLRDFVESDRLPFLNYQADPRNLKLPQPIFFAIPTRI